MRFPPPVDVGPVSENTAVHIRELARTAQDTDGVAPLSDQALVALGVDSPDVTHLVARSKTGTLLGYATVDRAGRAPSAELVVHPQHRRLGTGTMLFRLATRDVTLPTRSGEIADGRKRLRIWAHGNLPPAQSFARAMGLEPIRELLLLSRTISPSEPHAAVPGDLTVRAFRPEDAAAWLALNAQSFAAHPEQGRLTMADFDARRAEPWFDADGLILAEPDGGGPLAGFCWTKIDPETPSDGEIYVVGVAAHHRGHGLGRALTEAGLASLARRGVQRASLYVDGDNTAARRLYESMGFTRAALDVQYTTP